LNECTKEANLLLCKTALEIPRQCNKKTGHLTKQEVQQLAVTANLEIKITNLKATLELLFP